MPGTAAPIPSGKQPVHHQHGGDEDRAEKPFLKLSVPLGAERKTATKSHVLVSGGQPKRA